MTRITADAVVHCRVPAATKAAFSGLAHRQRVTDSTLLKRMIELALQSANTAPTAEAVSVGVSAGPVSRLTVRLREDDHQLLLERAAARGMAPATYVAVYVRSHLRALAPLPKTEYLAVRSAVLELSAIGRNLNQIARAANQGHPVPLPGTNEVRTMLRLCEALRDHMKALLLANLRSWEQGYANPDE